MDKNVRLLYVAKYLLEKSDESSPVSLADIINYLNSFGIHATRQTIYRDFDNLNAAGFEVLPCRTDITRYYHTGGTFELAEVKLLVDVVQASPFLTKKKSLDLISKLSSLVSENAAQELNRQVYVMNRPRTINESLYYTIDGINRAINENHQISFYYFDYTLDGKKEYRHQGKRYICNPVALCVDRYYYLVAYDDSLKDYRHYRLDRMEQIDVEKTLRCTLPQGFDLGTYVKTIFDMYNGENDTVQLRFDLKLLNNVIDKFGNEAMMHKDSDTTFTVIANVDVGPTFFGWISQFGTHAEILAPEKIRVAFKHHIASVLERYEKE